MLKEWMVKYSVSSRLNISPSILSYRPRMEASMTSDLASSSGLSTRRLTPVSISSLTTELCKILPGVSSEEVQKYVVAYIHSPLGNGNESIQQETISESP